MLLGMNYIHPMPGNKKKKTKVDTFSDFDVSLSHDVADSFPEMKIKLEQAMLGNAESLSLRHVVKCFTKPKLS